MKPFLTVSPFCSHFSNPKVVLGTEPHPHKPLSRNTSLGPLSLLGTGLKGLPSTGPDTEEDYQEDLLQQFYLYYSFTSFPFSLVNGNGGNESLPLPLQRKPHLWAASNGACWQTYGWSPGYVSNPVTVSLQLLLFFPLTVFFSENTFIQLEGWRQQQTVILSGSCSGRWFS